MPPPPIPWAVEASFTTCPMPSLHRTAYPVRRPAYVRTCVLGGGILPPVCVGFYVSTNDGGQFLCITYSVYSVYNNLSNCDISFEGRHLGGGVRKWPP